MTATKHADARLRHRTLILGVGLLLALCAFTTVGQSRASAVGVAYCTDVYLAGFDHCDAPARHSLTGNEAANHFGSSTTVCAGATLNGSFWGGYACGDFGYAEHCYDGTNLLVGRIHNGQSGAQHMDGAYYYSQACP